VELPPPTRQIVVKAREKAISCALVSVPASEYEGREASSSGESRQVGCAGWRLLTPLRAGPGRQNRLWRTPPVGRLHDVLEAISETQNTLQATGERWVEAELNRIAGEVALMLPEADTTRAEIYFDRALEVARKQQASPGNCAPQ
jgi:hypothetical protein